MTQVNYTHRNGGNMAGRVVPRRGFPASVYSNADGDGDRNRRLKINIIWI